MTPRTVLFVIDKLPRAGTQRHLVQVALGLDRSRWRPVVCTLLENGPLAEPLQRAGIPVHCFGMVSSVAGWRFPITILRLIQLIRRERPAVVHTYLVVANIVGSLAIRLAGAGCVVVTSRRDMGEDLTEVQRRLQLLSVRWSDRILVNSSAVRQVALDAEKIPQEKISLLLNGVDLPSEPVGQAPPQSVGGQGPDVREGLPPDAQVIGMVGNLRPVKGHDVVLRALPEILKQNPSAHLAIAGYVKDTVYVERLRRLAQQLGVSEHLHFLGERTDIQNVLNSFDLLVHASHAEGNSNAILEAMAAGLAVAATKVGGAADVIRHGETGLLVPPNDPTALAQAVNRLLADSAERLRIGQAARNEVRTRFGVPKMVENLDSLYRSLLPRLAYITSQFPCYDETFIHREMQELHRQGMPFLILPLKPCRDKIVHGEVEPLIPFVLSMPFIFSFKVLSAQAWALFTRPLKYAGALGWIIRRTAHHPPALIRSLALFPKAVAWARILSSKGVAHLHAHWATYPATAAMVIRRLTGISFSFTGHAHDIYTANPALAEKIQAARFVVTCTEANRRHLLSLVNGDGRHAPVHTVYHGLELERFYRAQPDGGSSNGTLKILSVGSLYECKGFDVLIRACARLKEMGLPFSCTIAGGGREEKALKGLIERLGLSDRIQLTGYITQEELPSLYRSADLFVLAARPEQHWGIPNTVVEAMAAGLPAICTALPSMPELIEDRINGLLLAEPEPEALAQALAELAGRPDLRRSFGEKAAARVSEGWNLKKNTAGLARLFSAAIDGNSCEQAGGLRQEGPGGLGE